MPIYEYECQKCKTRIEAFQKFSDKPRTKCTNCGGRLEKVISAAAIQFKGSGWYVTDYARKNGKDDKKSSDKSEKSETSSTTDSDKSDTKQTSPSKKTPDSSPSKKGAD